MPTNDTTLTTLTKDKYLIFLDVNKVGLTFSSNGAVVPNPTTTPAWKRIDKSTIFDLKVNEVEEERDYIDQENAITVVKSNKPELTEEIITQEGNPIHDFIANEFYSLPVGDACQVPFMACFGGTSKKAWYGWATISKKELNTVDGKYAFSIMMGGDITKGYYSITSGVPTFSTTPPNAAVKAEAKVEAKKESK